MADQKTPAAVAAEQVLAYLGERYDAPDGIDEAEGALLRTAITSIIAQATLDACEQAAPRVRAEERVAVLREVLALLDGDEDKRRSDDYEDVVEMLDDAVQASKAIRRGT